MTTIPPPHGTQGALYIGTSITGVLFGISCLQAFLYAVKYRSEDSWRLKSLVALVFVFDFMHQLTCTHAIYYYLISEYGHPERLITIPWSLIVGVEITAVIALAVQSFYVFRVYVLSSRNWWLTAAVGWSILPSFALETVYTIKFSHSKGMNELEDLAGIAKGINILYAVCDISIAVAMVYLLRRTCNSLSLTSEGVINRLLVFVVNTGVLTSVCATLALVWLFISPETNIYTIFYFIVPRLYANSLFAALNARVVFRAEAMRDEAISLHFVNPSQIDENSRFSHRLSASTYQHHGPLSSDLELEEGVAIHRKAPSVKHSSAEISRFDD